MHIICHFLESRMHAVTCFMSMLAGEVVSAEQASERSAAYDKEEQSHTYFMNLRCASAFQYYLHLLQTSLPCHHNMDAHTALRLTVMSACSPSALVLQVLWTLLERSPEAESSCECAVPVKSLMPLAKATERASSTIPASPTARHRSGSLMGKLAFVYLPCVTSQSGRS